MTKRIIRSVPALGQVSHDVGVLQERLNEFGFNCGARDDIFGPRTQQATSAFQKSKGLPGSGIIGPMTLKYLGLEVIPVDASGAQPITKDCKGRQKRFIHPTMRVMMEAKIFPGRAIPPAFQRRDLVAMAKIVCAGLDAMGIREVGGNNRGKKVGFVQAIIGPHLQNGTGDAWCMSLVQIIIAFIEDFVQVESPVEDSEHCLTVLREARKIEGLVSESCEEGTAFIAQSGKSTSGHTGMVMEERAGGKMRTFEGNTSAGNDRDGSGAYFRTRSQTQISSSLKVLAFVRLYPNNQFPPAAYRGLSAVDGEGPSAA